MSIPLFSVGKMQDSDSVKSRLLAQMSARLDARRKRDEWEEEGAQAAGKLARWDKPGRREGVMVGEDSRRKEDSRRGDVTGWRQDTEENSDEDNDAEKGEDSDDSDEEEDAEKGDDSDDGDDGDKGPKGATYCRFRTADKLR